MASAMGLIAVRVKGSKAAASPAGPAPMIMAVFIISWKKSFYQEDPAAPISVAISAAVANDGQGSEAQPFLHHALPAI